MAKLPSFGDSSGSTTGDGFKLPEFKAPTPAPTPKVVATKIAQTKVTAPTVKPQTGVGGTSAQVTPAGGFVFEGPVLKPIISAASAIFNTIGMPLGWFNGYQYSQAKENNSGIITDDDLRDAAAQGRKINGQEVKITGLKNGQPIYNIQPTVSDRTEIEAINARRRAAADANATAWTRGEQTKYGGDLMAEWGLDTTPGFAGISEAERIGFIRDLGTDPVNFIPFGALGAAAKATSKGLKGTYEATKLAARSEVSGNVAKALGLSPIESGRITSAPASVSRRFDGIEGEAAKVIEKAKTAIDDKLAYKTVFVSETNNPVVDNLAVIGSGLEAGYKALASSLVRSNLDNFLSKYAKADVTRSGKLRIQIVKPVGGNDYRILSGNGEELGRATTMLKAKEIAGRLRLGLDQTTPLAVRTADDVTKALDSVEREFVVKEAEQGAESAKLPEEAGEPGTIEPYTPYQTQDGKWWVYDGNKIYKTANEQTAQRVIDALLWTEKEVEAATISKVGRAYQVRAGEQIFPARTKAEAEAISTAYNEGTLPGAVAAARGQAVVDAKPTPLALADMLKVPAIGEEGKALKAILTKLDKVSAKATGVKALYKGKVKDRIKDIIRGGDALVDENKILAKTSGATVTLIKEAIAGKDSNPFALFEIDLKGNPLQPLVGNLIIKVDGEDPRKFATIVSSYKTWRPNNPPAAVKVAIESELSQLVNRIVAVKKSGAEKMGPQQKYELIKSEFGAEVADSIKATGILETFLKTETDKVQAAVKSFNAVIDGLLEKASQVNFTGIEDLIKQVKNNGVVVDETSLQQIFKLIDPNNNIVNAVDNAAVKEGNIYLYNELFKSEGIKTVKDMQIQITQLGDFDNLMKLSGISDDLLFGQMVKDMRNPEGGELTEFVNAAAAKEKKQAMAERVALADSSSEGKLRQARVLEAIAEANAATHAILRDEILPSPEAQIGTLDSFGKVVSRSTKEQYALGSKAIQDRTFNQVRQGKMFNVLVGLSRKALTRGKKPLNRQELMNETIKAMDLASDDLGLMDIRMTTVKLRADEDYVEAFEAAKGTKKKLDLTKEGNFAYLHLGDIMKTFQQTGANDLILEGFFPPTLTSGKAPKNYLSSQGFLDATRQALELRSKGKAIDVGQLASRILSGGLNPELYSAGFKAKYKTLARQIAEHLSREDVLEGLSRAHLEKSIGVADRWVNSAESIGEDLSRLLYEAWDLSFVSGQMDDMARVELIRSHLRKVLYISDIFRIEGGPIAESAIRAVSGMMLKRGLIRTPDTADEVTKLVGDQEAAAFRKIINTLYLYEKPQFAMKPGQTKFANPLETGKVQNRLVEAEENYASVMARVDEQYSPDSKVRQTFYKDRTAAQTKLDNARNAAIEIGLSTRHYSASKGWVPSDKFNFEAETRAAQRRLLNYESAKAGLKAREDFIADTRPVMPKATILTGKRRDEFLKKQYEKLAVVHVENAASRIRNANEEVGKLIDNQHYEKLGATPVEAAEMYHQRSIADGMVANTEIKVEFPGEAAVLYGTTKYGASREALLKDAYDLGLQVDEIAKGGRASERLYGLSKSRIDVAAIGRRRETLYHKITDRYANLLRGVSVVLRNTPPQIIEDAFSLIKRGEDIPADANAQFRKAYIWMERAWRPLIASVESAISTQRGFNGDMLAAAMKKMGLGDEFSSPAGLTPEDLPGWYNSLPFGDFVLPPGIAPDSDEARKLAKAFQENKDALKLVQSNPLITMLRLMQASQNVVYQKGLAEDFIARFSYKAENLTYAQAISKGYVQLKEVFGGETLLKYLPTPENGGLFPKDLAEQFFSINREYNQMFESAVAQKLQGKKFEFMMTAIGALKATQTILLPRHHITNLLGDMSTAMIRGVVNPQHWSSAARLATSFAIRRAGAEYFMPSRLKANPEEMERLFGEVFRSFGAEGRVLQGIENGKKTTGIVIYEGGKSVRKNLTDDDLMNLFEDWGIIEESIYQEDIQGLVDYLDAEGLGGVDKSTGEKIVKGFRTVVRKGTKAPGDLAAGYGNIPRIAHAMKLMHSRSWGSLEQAMDTIANEIALFHPTAKSLAATERQFGRFITTYYTWMRMAQVGMLRMIGENTRQVAAINKVMYEWNREQMGEDNRPINVGTSYGGDLNRTPAYLSSTAGVTRITGENLQGFLESTGLRNVVGDVPGTLLGKELQLIFPLMYNDALNYSKIDFDPYENLEGQIVSGIFGGAENGMNPGLLGVVGKNISLIGEPLVTALYGVDPATGKDVDLKTFGDVANTFLGSNIGLTKPVQAWTDPNLAAEEKFLGKFRSLIGLGLTDPQTEANANNAKKQARTRSLNFLDSIVKQEGIPKEGTVLYQLLEEAAKKKLDEEKK